MREVMESGCTVSASFLKRKASKQLKIQFQKKPESKISKEAKSKAENACTE